VNGWIELLWGVLGAGLILYALTGGADLGAGLWSLCAWGPRKDEQQGAIRRAIAPIWEANHVWLIFVIVAMFTAFPRAFAVMCIAFHVPILLALFGLVFRGAAFTFEAYGIHSSATRARWARVFSWSSLATPVLFGSVVGGLSSGRVRVVDGRVITGYFAGWTSPFAFSVGLFALTLFALLSAVYLAAETEGELAEDFRRRAVAAEVVAGMLAAVVFVLARAQAPDLHAILARSSWTWPVQLTTAACAGATLWCLLTRRHRIARFTVAGQVAMVVVGWGLAMDHHFVFPDVNVTNAGAVPAVLPAIALALAAGAVLLIPALLYLFYVYKLRSRND
jgi:cytochrome d ubiquinol oxidase subunit II